MKKVRIALALVLLVAFLPVDSLAVTQPQRAITISPAFRNQTVQPGAVYDGTFQVINRGQVPYTFKVYASEYSVKNEAYTPEFARTPGAPKISDWFTFDTTRVTLAAGQTKTIQYRIAVPPGIDAGGYYAVVFAQTEVTATSQGITPNQRVGEIFYLEVPGRIAREGSVLSWGAPRMQDGPLTASLRIQNSGGVHFPSTVKITFSDIFGSPKYSFTTEKFVLPHTVREIDAAWQESPGIGLFKVTGTATVLGKAEQLPAVYVLVMPGAVRILLLCATLLVGALLATRIIVSRRADRRKVAKA